MNQGLSYLLQKLGQTLLWFSKRSFSIRSTSSATMSELNNNQFKFRIPELIIKKRNGQKLSREEIDFFVEAVVTGHVQESQVGKLFFFLTHVL